MTAYQCTACPDWHTSDPGKARQHETRCGNPLVVRRGPPTHPPEPDDGDQMDLYNQ